MTYKFCEEESVAEAIKRVATEQTDKAIAELSNTDDLEVDYAVHQARKRMKKIRAIVRLVRDCLGSEAYKQENARFRDIARGLSDLRDKKVLIDILDDLTNQSTDEVIAETFIDMRRELRVDYRQEYQRILDEAVMISVIDQLKEAKMAIANWQIEEDGWDAIAKSLKRVYKRGYKGLENAVSNPTLENFHEWRKRVKYLRYQLKMLRPIWTDMIEEWIVQTHNLSDYLGEDHDLAVLKKSLSTQPERFDRHSSLAIVTSLCNSRQTKLQSAAIFLGQKIYTEKPKDFVTRLGNYWYVWQKELEKS